MYSQCRLCADILPEKEAATFKNIFNDKNILIMIEDTLSFKIIDHESLPSYICSNCDSTISNFFNYKLTCKDIQDKFVNSLEVKEKQNKIDKLLKLDKVRISEEPAFSEGLNDFVNIKLEPISDVENTKTSVETVPVVGDARIQKGTKSAKVVDEHFNDNDNENQIDSAESLEEDGMQKEFALKSKSYVRKARMKKSRKENSTDSAAERPYKCEFCNQQFVGRKAYVSHQRKCRTEISTPVRCHLCSKIFSKKTSLKSHVRGVHNYNQKYCCDFCGDTFTAKSNLKFHLISHGVYKQKFKCTFCKHETPYKSALKIHITNVHKVNRRHQCSDCGKIFGTSTLLKQHALTHGEKLNKCNVCGKGFFLKKDLRNHVSIHTGVKPFSCAYCGKKTRLKLNLYQHLKLHSKRNLPKEKEIIEEKSSV